MDVFDAISQRCSVRSYLNKPVEDEKLRSVLEAARLAPSARNLQEWRFVVVTDRTTREKLMAAAMNQKFVGEAPVVIAACAVNTENLMPCGQYSYPIDIAIAVDHMTLMAVELGLGTCWIGAFKEDEVKEILDIPEQVRVVTLLTLGYPATKAPAGKNRLPLEEIAFREKSGQK